MKVFKYIALSLLCLFNLTGYTQDSLEIKSIKVLEVNSSINPAVLNYLETNLDNQKNLNTLVIIKLDTPGGLVTTTKDIITLIGKAEFPVAIWITPEGASATSAGAIIAASAHLLFMSEGTNIGAATPIEISGDIKETDGRKKAINDLVALVTSLAKTRGRNSDPFEKMISEAKSYDAKTAIKENIIDNIANTLADIKDYAQNKKIKLHGKVYILSIHDAVEIKSVEMDLGQVILNIFSNPTTAYILFVIGAALLYFEFQSPGGFVAGSVGAVCLILAGIGFQVLPLNFGALGLIILSFILFILEAYITSYGVLTLSGILSLVFGSMFLFRTQDAYLSVETSMIMSVAAGIIIYILIISYLFIKYKSNQQNFFQNTELTGSILKFLRKEGNSYIYQVKVNGEIWNAKADSEFELGEQVLVTQQDDERTMIKIQKVN